VELYLHSPNTPSRRGNVNLIELTQDRLHFLSVLIIWVISHGNLKRKMIIGTIFLIVDAETHYQISFSVRSGLNRTVVTFT
jgi:hypothetical protein